MSNKEPIRLRAQEKDHFIIEAPVSRISQENLPYLGGLYRQQIAKIDKDEKDEQDANDVIASSIGNIHGLIFSPWGLERRRRELEEEIILQRRQVNKDECSQWCNKYHERLPQELRDMIYAELLPLRPIYLIISALQSGSKPDPDLFSPSAEGQYHQLLDRRVVSNSFLAELMVTMYKNTAWSFTSLEHVPRFLERSYFADIGLPEAEVQPRALVQHLHIQLPSYKGEYLVQNLTCLESLKCKTAVELELQLYRRYPPWLLSTLREIAPWIFQMKSREYKPKVFIRVDDLMAEVTSYMGGSLYEFEEWTAKWPMNINDFRAIRKYILALV